MPRNNAQQKASSPNGNEHGPTGGGWKQVETDALFYNPETCSKEALQGYLLGEQEMPPMTGADGAVRPWSVFVVRTTAPTLAAASKQEPKMVPAGTVVVVGLAAGIKGLRKFLDAERIIEIWIKPSGMRSLPGGRNMRIWNIRANDETIIPRTALEPTYRKALTSGSGAQEEKADELPF